MNENESKNTNVEKNNEENIKLNMLKVQTKADFLFDLGCVVLVVFAGDFVSAHRHGTESHTVKFLKCINPLKVVNYLKERLEK